MAITTTTTLPSQVQQYFSMKLLSVPVPNMIHKTAATKRNMPRNSGNTALVPLGNTGVTPPSQNLTRVDIDARINFYGSKLLGAVTVYLA